MMRALVTALLCIGCMYVGCVLIISWQEHKFVAPENDFAEAAYVILYFTWVTIGLVLLFLPFGIMVYRHQ